MRPMDLLINAFDWLVWRIWYRQFGYQLQTPARRLFVRRPAAAPATATPAAPAAPVQAD